MLGSGARPPRRHEPRTARTPEYVFGYPRAVVRVVGGELPALLISTLLFVVGPTLTAWYVVSSPWHLSVPWYLVALPLGVVLAAIATWASLGLVTDVRDRCGIRVVPRFERRLDPGPETYFSGRRIAARMQRLDAMAAASDVRMLSDYGFARGDDVRGEWFDAAHGSATVAALLARVEPSSTLHAELSGLLRALRRAEAEGVGFRLVLVSGTGMNGMLWERLRKAGF